MNAGQKWAKATEKYVIVYKNPIKLLKGDQVRVLKYEDTPEWKGWVYCSDHRGFEGWVSETYLQIESQTALVLKYYDATEIDLTENQIVQILNEEFGWAWVRNENNQEGWVPLKNLQLTKTATESY